MSWIICGNMPISFLSDLMSIPVPGLLIIPLISFKEIFLLLEAFFVVVLVTLVSVVLLYSLKIKSSLLVNVCE